MIPSKVISLYNLSKFFGSFAGVMDISLDVQEGEIFGFLGPNGAGKTTTIRLMLDLLRPSSGRIEIFGKELSENSFEIRKRCGYLPGSFTAYMNLNGMEFLHLCADIRKVPRAIDQQLLQRFELSGQNLDRKIKNLSHGTLQKLGIVQAFFHKPELLILDEPTTGLDPLMQEEFYELLKECQQGGSTIFISSHNLAEVEKICHRMAIVRTGKITKVDSIENLRQKLVKTLKFSLLEEAGEFTIPGAELMRKAGLTYEYSIHGDLKVILNFLAGLPIAEIFIPEPGLDEIFINYYKDRPND